MIRSIIVKRSLKGIPLFKLNFEPETDLDYAFKISRIYALIYHCNVSFIYNNDIKKIFYNDLKTKT